MSLPVCRWAAVVRGASGGSAWERELAGLQLPGDHRAEVVGKGGWKEQSGDDTAPESDKESRGCCCKRPPALGIWYGLVQKVQQKWPHPFFPLFLWGLVKMRGWVSSPSLFPVCLLYYEVAFLSLLCPSPTIVWSISISLCLILYIALCPLWLLPWWAVSKTEEISPASFSCFSFFPLAAPRLSLGRPAAIQKKGGATQLGAPCQEESIVAPPRC